MLKSTPTRHDNQFAFRKGRSTEHALSKMVDYAETHTAKLDSYVVVVYIDIKGAFDTISTDAIKDAIEKHGLDDRIQAWYGKYLDNRQCSAAALGTPRWKLNLNKEAPRGVSRPLFGWSLPFDGLIHAYNTTSTQAIPLLTRPVSSSPELTSRQS
jgi:hypothetical protein